MLVLRLLQFGHADTLVYVYSRNEAWPLNALYNRFCGRQLEFGYNTSFYAEVLK
jgi:hypothetical protein